MKIKGFKYSNQKYRFIAYYKDGKWQEGELSTNNMLEINEASTALHYGQQCFEGLKAYKSPTGDVNLFRPDLNSKRLNESCDRLLMPQVSEDFFIDACKQVVKANLDVVPAYGDGSSLYLRPMVFGIGENIGIKPASEYMFVIFVVPVGEYFSGGFKPVNFCTTKYDRAAANGTGGAKVGGNYAASLIAHQEAVEKGYKDCIYLDPIEHKKIEEVGAANFFGITKANEFVTPISSSILNSITKRSLMDIAKNSFDMKVVERDCYIDNVLEFDEIGACGTAAVITPIHLIEHNGVEYKFGSPDVASKKITKLYNKLVDIQYGIDLDYKDWLVKVN